MQNPPVPSDLQPNNQNPIAVHSASLHLWQRRIVALVYSGVPIREAATQQRVSWASIDAFTNPRSPRFSQAFADAIANAEALVAIQGADAARELAVAHTEAMVAADVSDGLHGADWRERRGARNALYEVAGLKGQPSTVQVNVANVSANQERWEAFTRRMQARANAQQPPPLKIKEEGEPSV